MQRHPGRLKISKPTEQRNTVFNSNQTAWLMGAHDESSDLPNVIVICLPRPYLSLFVDFQLIQRLLQSADRTPDRTTMSTNQLLGSVTE